tara:strand:+ start:4017 stop:5657 length:1641 start_codon:yes stop_codon:yes gene_type:complete
MQYTGQCAKRYRSLETERNYRLEKARDAGRLTLPYLISQSDDPAANQNSDFPLPWNGIGARGTHNLTSKILISLLPPTDTFFRFTIDEIEMAKNEEQALGGGASPEDVARQKTEFDMALARLERAVLHSIETSNDRLAVHEMLMHLIVGGNALLYVSEEGLKCFHLSKYVLRRDPIGNPLEAIVCEKISIEALPETAKELVNETAGDVNGIVDGDKPPEYQQSIPVYTHVQWQHKTVEWYQEINGQEVPGSKGSCSAKESAWLPLRMYRIDGDSYSPGYIEAACMADLQTAEALSQAIAEGALVSAQVKHLVKPAGIANPKRLAEAANGAYLPGNPDDVFTIQVNKAADLNIALQSLSTIEMRLSQAFMLQSPRDAERVTAEEIRLQALQLENALGSIYAILTTEFVQPYVSRKLAILTRKGKLPKLPSELVKPVVSVGLSSIGRGNDLEKTARFMQILQQTIGPEGIGTYVQPNELIRRLASAMGMDLNGLVKTEEQIAEEQQAAQQAQLVQQAMQAGMADPQKLANAAATTQELAQPQPTEEQQ